MKIKRRSLFTESHEHTTAINTDHSQLSNEHDYDPVHFLRCHSKRNGDAADVQTQVWQCLFEPNPADPSSSSSIVATCGGHSVCFIDVETGDVASKYYTTDLRELFYCLAWTTLHELSVLAVGGTQSKIHLISYKWKCEILEHPLNVSRKVFIAALLFHPVTQNIMFCATSDGDIRVCLIDDGDPEEFQLQELATLSANCELFSLAFCLTTHHLLFASTEGLGAWHLPLMNNFEDAKCLRFTMPENIATEVVDKHSGQLLDSVEVLGDGLIAIKFALHGAIYLVNLEASIAQAAKTLSIVLTLQWSDTDNYFMSVGAQKEAGLLACGDDRGALWLYDISQLHRSSRSETVAPTCILPWPDVSDKYVEKQRKLPMKTYDIVIAKVAVQCSGRHIVAVTNNNLVCVWRKAFANPDHEYRSPLV